MCRNGRRGGLKIPCANNTCGFDPHHRHKKEALQLVWGAFFLSAACERVEQHDPAQQGSNQPCGLLLSARETPTTGIASSSKSKGFGLFFFFCPVSYTLAFSGKILTMEFAEDTLSPSILSGLSAKPCSTAYEPSLPCQGSTRCHESTILHEHYSYWPLVIKPVQESFFRHGEVF